jgi:putative tryptophan/tyrosine transport system substrate-binding protein
MDRRAFLAGVTGGIFAAPLAAEGQTGRMPTVGILDPSTEGADTTLKAYALIDGMRELGWVDGHTVALNVKFANRNQERLAVLAQQLVVQKVEVIAAVGTEAALAARRATSTVPIVMVGVGDPVRVGLVKNLGRPENNLTGVSLLLPELWGKRVELFRELLSRLSRLALLYEDTTGSRNSLQEMRAVSRRLGIELRPTAFRSREALADSFAELRAARPDGVAIVASPVLDELRGQLAELALKHRLPTLLAFPEYAEAGGLVAYGPSLAATHRRAAYYVDKILKGAKPADLPVEQPTTYRLAINLKTAKALGLTMPTSLLQRADQVIE